MFAMRGAVGAGPDPAAPSAIAGGAWLARTASRLITTTVTKRSAPATPRSRVIRKQ